MNCRNDPPHLESFSNIQSKIANILDWATGHCDDYIYHRSVVKGSLESFKIC
jgi:hypothetical protein